MCLAGSCLLVVRVSLWFVLVGSGYLHALNLLPAGSCLLVVRACWKWLLACLETRILVAWCALLVCLGWKWLPACLETRVLGSCLAGSCWLVSWLVWLPARLEPRVLGLCVPGSCPGWCGYLHALKLVSLVRALLVRVSLVGSGYLHTLNLVSLVRAGWCPGWCGYLHALKLVSLVRALLVCLGWKW